MLYGLAQSPDPQTTLAWSQHYAFTLGWVIIPIHRIVGLNERGEEVCSCEATTGKKWKNCVGKGGKHPWCVWKDILTPQLGFDAFTNAFNQNPNGVNIGIRTGKPSGFFAIDIDVGPNKFGVENFGKWLGKNNLSYEQLNEVGAIAKTGGGGFHFLFNYPDGVDNIPTQAPQKDMGPDVDLKGDGGYIIVAPSIHRSGNQYSWMKEGVASRDDLPVAPNVIVNTVKKQAKSAGTLTAATYTPNKMQLVEYAEKCARKKGSDFTSTAGKNMVEALKGNAIAIGEGDDEGTGGHDSYRDIMFCIARQWPRCDSSEVLEHFQDSVQMRFAYKEDASTDMSNLVDAMETALSKVKDQASTWLGKVLTNESGRVVSNDANLLLYFRNHEAWKGVFAFDLRLNKPVYKRRPPIVRSSKEYDATSDKSDMALWMQTEGDFSGKVGKDDLMSAITASARDNEFDPLVEMLNELKGKWDGVPRLSNVLQRVAGVIDDDWTKLVFRKFMISCVARILVPGSKVDTMFILEGPQGYRKSTLLSALLPDKRYFSDGVSKVKSDVETLRLIHSGPLIFELGELSGLRKQEVDEIKAFLSTMEDLLRPLYEAPRQIKRRCIFVGSTNLNDYLRDSTGGRRFWPVVVTRIIDIQTVINERAQLWAEALALYGDGSGIDGRGERWWLETTAEHELAMVEQDKRFDEDHWTPVVRTWLENRAVPIPEGGATTQNEQMQEVANSKLAGDYVTVVQVLEHACKVDIQHGKSGEAKRVEGILRRDGWLPTRIYIAGKRTRVWKRPLV